MDRIAWSGGFLTTVSVALRWSTVVIACLLPIIALLLHLRTWLGRRATEMRKFLHLLSRRRPVRRTYGSLSVERFRGT
jgi:hypothetical protein